ncbi:MAG: protein kinase [Gemmataceae bacterium]
MEDADYLHRPDSEPIPGYRLLHPLGRGGFGEVWKCEAPGGLHKAVKFVHGGRHILDDHAPALDELQAIQHVKSIRHPFILTLERVEIVDGELVMVMELADQSLADLLEAQLQNHQAGLARTAILNYLREASEVLDVMQSQHGVQHLDIKPRNLFLVSNHVKVGDFGLVTTLAGGKPGSGGLGAITPRYAAPELFQGEVSPHSDQYSLAIVYQELLTGHVPFDGKNSRQLMFQHLQSEPDLQPLPAGDRLIVARALSKDPAKRFGSCMELVEALVHEHGEVITLPVGSSVPPEAPVVGPKHDTRTGRAMKTVRTTRIPLPTPPFLLPGHGLEITGLNSRTPLTEVWNARAHDGATWQVKVLFGCPGPQDPNVARLGRWVHPALLPIQVLQHMPGRLVLASPTGHRTLRDLLTDHLGQGLPGVPRRLALAYLWPIAETLHTLATEDGLQHLGLNPRTLVLDGDRCRVADFGLAQLVWQPVGQPIGQQNARYAAPELLSRQVHPTSDQYSLATVYHELITGGLPSQAPPTARGEPAAPRVDRLPEAERSIIARALHPDPAKRWESLVALFRALEAVTPTVEAATARNPAVPVAFPAAPEPAADGQVVRLGTNLTPEAIRERLEGFGKQWNAQLVSSSPRAFVYQLQTSGSLWQRWTGTQPRVDIEVRITDPDVTVPHGVQVLTEVHVGLRPRNCSADQSAELVQQVVPILVESVRTHLRVNPRGRMHERIVWHHPLRVRAIAADGSLGEPIECQGKDISLTGIGFYLPGQLPASQVLLELPRTPQTPRTALRGRVVRMQNCGDGWFEVGAVLMPPDDHAGEDDALTMT